MNKRDRVNTIKDYTSIGQQAFATSRLHQDAVVRNFEIIGEASNRLSKKFRDQTAVSWGELKAFRNFLIRLWYGE
ncbi:MAG: DUF86 domain-containing protein [Magnetospirillum sp.]|nr:DUF86 domain-containing protein [Magnetospirillum sp.]